MGWPSTLSYRRIAATGIARSLEVVAAYGDLETARAMLATDSSLAEDPAALAVAAENGHEPIVRLLLQHRPRLAERVAVVAPQRELTEMLFQSGMNPNLREWLGVTPLHRFARQGGRGEGGDLPRSRCQPRCARRRVLHYAAWIRGGLGKAAHGRIPAAARRTTHVA